MAEKDVLEVDWSALPVPIDDGAARHLVGRMLPSVVLKATDDMSVDLSALSGRSVIYIYPLTAQPGHALPDGWDEIPGARGCTPQSCAFRDHYGELRAAGADHVFGLSPQDSVWQREAVSRLHLPFPLLSDEDLALTNALNLPTFEVAGRRLLKRMSLVLSAVRIVHVFYPVFPPDRNAADVVDWLRANRA